jgi:hypothetical protein
MERRRGRGRKRSGRGKRESTNRALKRRNSSTGNRARHHELVILGDPFQKKSTSLYIIPTTIARVRRSKRRGRERVRGRGSGRGVLNFTFRIFVHQGDFSRGSSNIGAIFQHPLDVELDMITVVDGCYSISP